MKVKLSNLSCDISYCTFLYVRIPMKRRLSNLSYVINYCIFLYVMITMKIWLSNLSCVISHCTFLYVRITRKRRCQTCLVSSVIVPFLCKDHYEEKVVKPVLCHQLLYLIVCKDH